MYGFSMPDAMIKPKKCEDNRERSSDRLRHDRELADVPKSDAQADCERQSRHSTDHRKQNSGWLHYSGYRDRHDERRSAVIVSLSRAERETGQSDFTEDEGPVRTTKPERVFHCNIDRHVARGIGAVIEITRRILIEDVDSRR